MNRIENKVNNEKRLLRNTIYMYLMKFSLYVFPLITIPYLTRVLQENNYGVYTWSNAIISYARIFIDFGLVIYGVEIVARCKDDKKNIGEVITTITIFKFILSMLTLIGLILLCFFVDSFYEYRKMIFISFLPAFISIFSIDYVFQGIEDMKKITLRTLITRGLFTVMIFVFIRKSSQYYFVPIFTAIGDAISVVFMWIELIKKKIKPQKFSKEKLISIIKNSKWFFYSAVMGAIYTYGDTIVIGTIMDKNIVAQYGIANTILAVAQNCIAPMSEAFHPYMIKNKNFKLIKKTILIFEPIIILGCIIMYFISPTIVPFIFGEQYVEAGYILRYMLPIVIVTLPMFMFGYPTLSSLNLNREANMSVILAGIIHAILLGLFYVTKTLTLEKIIFCIFISNLFNFLFRYYAYRKNIKNFINN